MALSDEGLVEFTHFKGLRNNVDAGNYELGDLEVAQNIDLDDDGEARMRRGYGAPVVAGAAHSVWASGKFCFAVVAGDLVQVLPGMVTKTLVTGLGTAPVSYELAGARVFWTNGEKCGVISDGANRAWGITAPAPLRVSAIGGALPPGQYQAVMSYLSHDGRESGASRATLIDLPNGGGIQFSSLPVSVDPTVWEKVIYVTQPNGEELREIGYFPASTTSAVFSSPAWPGGPLRTQHLAPAPAGSAIGVVNGHMLVAQGELIYPSEPYNFEMFDLRKYLPFPSQVTMIAPIGSGSTGGAFIGTQDKTLYVSGASPDVFEYRVVAEYGVIPGSLVYETDDFFGAKSSGGRAALWTSKNGLCVGFEGGRVSNLTADRFSYPTTEISAAAARRWRGIHQYLVTMRGTEVAGNANA